MSSITLLNQTPAKSVAIAAGGVAAGCIFLCYGIAVSLGHVPAWLPMISDCAVQAPEKYLFRLGIIPSAMMLELSSFLMLYFQSAKGSAIHISDVTAFAIASLGNLGLATVGAVNEDENKLLHGASAVIFFFAYDFYMIFIALGLRNNTLVSRFSLNLKKFLAAFTTALLTLFVFFSTDHGKYKLQIAICEWLGVYSIITYNLSFISEFQNAHLDVATVEHDGAATPQNKRQPELIDPNLCV